MKSFTDEPNKAILGYNAVRDAAKDWEQYSSNLQGDRDVRDYPQLPLEVDPPAHTSYRHAIQSLFLRPKLEELKPKFEDLAKGLLEKLGGRGEVDVYTEISLPYVVGCLTLIYNRPQDFDEWISWGPDVWTAESPTRSGKTLHGYLARVFEEEPKDDVWGFIRSTRPLGEPLTEAEFRGYASVLLAGGRDTVIKLISGLVWHLLNKPEDLAALKEDPSLERSIINELLRFLTPLPAIERVKTDETSEAEPVYHRLHFASANYDESIWEAPDQVNIYRGKQPHLAFGYGPHACIGMNLAEYEARAFITSFLTVVDKLKLSNFELIWDEISGTKFLADLRNVRVLTW
jgi:cytochrome P450